ncbi:MAG: hypothetical protein P4N59_03390 [Negativicutes bacterium]|nr:hypothetical protein [Negativicutes bacterium]
MRYKPKIDASQEIAMTDFSGGAVNLPSERLPANAFNPLQNWEYNPNDNSLVTAAGLTAVYTSTQGANLDSLFYSNVLGTIFFTAGGYLYESTLSAQNQIGALSGPNPGKYWHFDGKLFVTTGGLIQYYDGATFTTLPSGTPNADSIIDRDGRIEVTKAGDDNQYYSAIGAYATLANWTHNTNDASSAFSQPVGYKDSSSTVAAAALSTDIMVFKSPKRAYRVYGDPSMTNYAIYEASRDVDVANANSICLVDNNLYIFGSNGFDSLQTVQAYGAVQKVIPSVGGTWNTFFRQNMDSTCKIWNVKSRSQVWIRYNNSGNIALYHYHAGGVFSFRNFESPVIDITENNQIVYIAIGKKIYKIDENSAQTETKPIVANLAMSKLGSVHDFILEWFKFSFYSLVSGTGQITLPNNVNGGSLVQSFASSSQSANAYTDTQNAYTDTTEYLVYPEDRVSVQAFCMYRVTGIQPQVMITSGRFSLREIKFLLANG